MKLLSGDVDQKKFGVLCLDQISVATAPRKFMQFLLIMEQTICSRNKFLVRLISSLMFTHLSSALTLLTASLVTMWRSKLVACTPIGVYSHQRRSRILRLRNLKIGTTRSTFLILRIRNLRVMMTSLRRLRIQMPRSQRIGMTRKMVNGQPQPSLTLSTRVSGSPRKLRISTTRASGRHQ